MAQKINNRKEGKHLTIRNMRHSTHQAMEVDASLHNPPLTKEQLARKVLEDFFSRTEEKLNEMISKSQGDESTVQ